MKELLGAFEFTSNNKFNVRVYENRVEIESVGVGNLFAKGLTGICAIYFKNLSAIEFSQGYMEFLCPGYVHVDSTTKKVAADNVILFTKKECDKAKELYDLINSLIG